MRQSTQMPLYAYKCPVCSKQMDGWNKVDDRHDGPFCADCDKQMDLQIVPGMSGIPDIEPFQCTGFDHDEPGNPTHFRSRKHMKDELRARGLRVSDKYKDPSRWV